MMTRRRYDYDDDSYDEQHEYLYNYDSYEERHDYLYDDEPEELDYPRVNWHSDWPYSDEDELPVSIIEFDPVEEKEEEEIDIEFDHVDEEEKETVERVKQVYRTEDDKWTDSEWVLQHDISYRFGRIYAAIKQEFGGQFPAIIEYLARQDPALAVARYLWMVRGEIPTRVMELLSGVESVPELTNGNAMVEIFVLGEVHEREGSFLVALIPTTTKNR